MPQLNLVSASLVAILSTLALGSPLQAADDAVVLQAEDAKLSDAQVSSKITGYTGTGYVEGFDSPTAQVSFTFDSPTQSEYDFSIYYGGPFGDASTSVTINKGESSVNVEVPLPPADVWATAKVGKIALNEGTNTIDLLGKSGNFYIDSITLATA